MLKKIKNNTIVYICAAGLLLSGCASIGLAQDATFESNYENKPIEMENIYVSSADVMISSIDLSSAMADFCVLGTSEIKTLSFDGATYVTDKYGQSISIAQLMPGDIATIAYNSTVSKVGSIALSSDAFALTEITKYSINESGSELTIGDDIYSINPGIHIFSSGSEITLDQLINHDELTIQGKGHDVLSIRVDDGHGYLDLENETALVGGWIEIGQTVISQVMADMLFTVPEGNYTVRLTNEGIEEYRDVTISRNEVTVLDLSDIVSAVPEKGIISFRIYPETAVSYVDGSFVDTNYSIKLPLGMHEITSSASGYSTVTQYFEVTGLNQLVEVDLEEATIATSVSSNTVNRNLYANIIIDNPQGAEVYEDNIYKGISPVSYQKTVGTHTITFRKPGYVTVSYTITVYDDGQDQSYSFPDMISDSQSSVSGNSVSANNLPNSVSGNNLLPSVSGNSVSANTITSY